MSGEITTGGGRELAHRQEERGITVSQRLTLLREALTNPDVQPEKAVAMAELMFKLEDRDARAAFIAAKVSAIAQMPVIGKNARGQHHAFSSWEYIQPIVTPVLNRNGLVLNFKIDDAGGRVAVTPVLSGHGWLEEGGTVVAPADKGPGRNDVQAVVSTATLLKRHSASAMLNLVFRGVVSEDDDGAAGGGTPLDPYEALEHHERQLVDEGRLRAADGEAPYAEWFKGLEAAQKGFLAYNRAGNGKTWHDQNKACAEAVDGG